MFRASLTGLALLALASTAHAGQEDALAAAAQHDTSALHQLQALADAGNAVAEDNLAKLYFSGQGVAPDKDTGLKWLRRAADQGNADAQYGLGYILFVQYQTSQNTQERRDAFAWWTKAAQQGYAVAQSDLGTAYWNLSFADPLHGQEDYDLGIEWIRKAATQGYADAQYTLAHEYETDQKTGVAVRNYTGLPHDLVLAYFFYSLIAAGGNEQFGLERDHIATALSPAQLAEAKDLAASWHKGMPLPVSSKTGQLAAARSIIVAQLCLPDKHVAFENAELDLSATAAAEADHQTAAGPDHLSVRHWTFGHQPGELSKRSIRFSAVTDRQGVVSAGSGTIYLSDSTTSGQPVFEWNEGDSPSDIIALSTTATGSTPADTLNYWYKLPATLSSSTFTDWLPPLTQESAGNDGADITWKLTHWRPLPINPLSGHPPKIRFRLITAPDTSYRPPAFGDREQKALAGQYRAMTPEQREQQQFVPASTAEIPGC